MELPFPTGVPHQVASSQVGALFRLNHRANVSRLKAACGRVGDARESAREGDARADGEVGDRTLDSEAARLPNNIKYIS